MARDLEQHGKLRSTSATAMWAAYGVHTVLTAWLLRRTGDRLPLPTGPAKATGTALAVFGLATCLAGMRRFAGTSELSGTRNQTLTTTGIYRRSRNPQYVGYVTLLAGAALSRRRGAALALTGVLAAAYALWVPVEETHLRDVHGKGYEDYQRRTNRWWGRPSSTRSEAPSS